MIAVYFGKSYISSKSRYIFCLPTDVTSNSIEGSIDNHCEVVGQFQSVSGECSLTHGARYEAKTHESGEGVPKWLVETAVGA